MQRTCPVTSTAFEVDEKDIAFYEKISPTFAGKTYNIPPPTLCPDARKQRQMLWRGKEYFFRPCDKTGEMCMSIFPPDAKMTTYSEKAFASEDWNGLKYGRDFNFSRPFFDQFMELWYATPKQTSNAYMNENCDYIINAHKNKNCYLVDELDGCQDCYYGYNVQYCEDMVNCFYVRKCKQCYEVSQADNCYETFFSHNIHNSHTCAFVQNSRNCHHCLFCTNLRNAEYHMFNTPVSKEEFEQAWQSLFCGKQSVLNQARNTYAEFLLQHPVQATIQVNTEGSTGDQLCNTKDCYDCYNVDNCRDCRYCTDIHYSKDAYDVHIYEGEIMYECLHAGPEGYEQFFSHLAWFSRHTWYSSQLLSCKNVFGCSALKNQEYCILNKKYSKEDYEHLVGRIIEHMQNTGEWGEFFPSSFSPYGYNQTMAAWYFPLGKEEATTKGFTWVDEIDPYDTMQANDLPDDLAKFQDADTKLVYKSTLSGKKYKITLPELEFHRRYNIPLPTTTPAERMEWFVAQSPRTLYQAICAKCGQKTSSTHNPAHNKTVYCTGCYVSYIR